MILYDQIVMHCSPDISYCKKTAAVLLCWRLKCLESFSDVQEWFASRLQQMADSLAEQSRPALAPDLPASELPLQVIGVG